jgi:hypothetical protein
MVMDVSLDGSRIAAKDTAARAMMVVARWRGCHFGDKCGQMRRARQFAAETRRMAPGELPV